MIDISVFTQKIDIAEAVKDFPREIEISAGTFINIENIEVDKYLILYNDYQLCKVVSLEKNYNKTITVYLITEIAILDNNLYLRVVVPEDKIKILSNHILN